MAKFELSVYDAKTGEVKKTCGRNFCPVSLYLKFHELSEKITNDKIESDEEMFSAFKPLFLEAFSDLTEDEYMNNTDVAEVILLFRNIVARATRITSPKNA